MATHGKARYDKHGCRCGVCRADKARYQREYRARYPERERISQQKVNTRYHENRQVWLERLGGACVECGATENLHFDHIDPTSKETGMDVLFRRGTFEEIEAEAAKCQLLCQPHHSTKTQADLRKVS